MARQMIQDVIPTRSKDIRRIPIPERKQPSSKEVIREVREEFENYNKPKRSWNKKLIVITVIILVAVIVLLLTTVFAKATVTITPATQTAAVNASLAAEQGTTTTSAIDFEPITLTQKETVTVTGTGTKQVDTKATGTIIIFNSYSTATQKLVANTRFETAAGLIYRIDKSVVVPGETTKAGVTTPGSITATVTADQSGANYNIPLSDFTIPGFAGEPEFKGFFARSQTVMSGGFSGTVAIISDTDRANAQSTLKSDLKSKLAQSVAQSVAKGYVLYPTGYQIVTQDLPDTSAGTN
ncbi:MAG TPA: hypothetical protein VMR73_02515, partial [Candidatus Paceibacterota bacterium]|nr:hypothetical protein [Candidatus Paceibacterota bacterium]